MVRERFENMPLELKDDELDLVAAGGGLVNINGNNVLNGNNVEVGAQVQVLTNQSSQQQNIF